MVVEELLVLVMLMEVLRRQDVRYDRHSGVQPNPHQPTDHSVGDELVPVNTAIDDKPGSNDRGITPAFGELQCVQRNFQRSGLSPRPENAVGPKPDRRDYPPPAQLFNPFAPGGWISGPATSVFNRPTEAAPVKGGIPNALALRHEQQYDAADRGGDAGNQLATYSFLLQKRTAQEQGHQRVADDERRDDRNRPKFEGSGHRQDGQTVA